MKQKLQTINPAVYQQLHTANVLQNHYAQLSQQRLQLNLLIGTLIHKGRRFWKITSKLRKRRISLDNQITALKQQINELKTVDLQWV